MGKRRSFFKIMIGDFKTHLRIPPAFKKHLRRLRDKSVLRLRDRFGGLWRVEVGRVGGDWFFHHGWEAFVADHAVAFGDFIVFLHDGRLGFDVKIFGKSGCEKAAANYGSLGLTMALSNVERERVLQAARSYKTTQPSFITAYKKSCNYSVTIPSVFVREYGFRGKESTVLQNPVGRSWTVKFACHGDGRIKLGDGWLDFRRGNCLGEGDVCVFELVRGGNAMHVHIFRIKEDTKELVEKSGVKDTEVVTKSGGYIQSDRRSLINSDRNELLQLANSLKTRNSTYVSLWRRTRFYYMGIPNSFVTEHDLKLKDSLILHDPFGRSWPVNLSLWKDGRVNLGSGWSNFVRGNRLREGDACVFEFLQEVNIMRVHIFRAGETDK